MWPLGGSHELFAVLKQTTVLQFFVISGHIREWGQRGALFGLNAVQPEWQQEQYGLGSLSYNSHDIQ